MKNPELPETKAQTVGRFAARHNEAVCLIVGFVLGILATVAGVVVG